MESINIAQDIGFASSLGDLVLRVHGGPADGEIVRFSERKSTIGSDAACTYRICDDRIQSVQCLILRGSGGSLVRRWADGALLNGEQFLDSHLRIGDRLMIGPAEMEVIEDNSLPHSPAEFPSHREEPQPSELDAQQTDRLRSMEESWQEMCDGLRQEMACLQEENQAWQDQRSRWESEMAEYQDALSNLARQFDEFQHVQQQEHDAWLEELQQLQALAEAAASARAEPTVEDAILPNEETVPAANHVDDELRPDEGSEARFDRFICDEMETSESEEEPEQEEEPRWLEDRGSFLQQPDLVSDSFEADEESHDAATDVMAVEDEYTPDASHVTEDQDQSDASAPDEDTATTEPPNWLVQYQEQQDESDSSISDYMNRLLQRVGGDDEASSLDDRRSVEAHASVTEGTPSSETVADALEAETEPAEPAALPEPKPSSPFPEERKKGREPSTAAPERASNLAAMRELANASARNAIHTCDKKRTAKSAMGGVPLLLIGLVCGALMLYWAHQCSQAIAYVGAIVCFTAAAITGVRTLWLFSRTALAALRMPRFRETAKTSHTDDAS